MYVYSELRDIKTDETRFQKSDQNVSAKKNIIPEKECVTSFEKHDLKIFNSVVKKIFGLLRAVTSG